MKRFHLHFTVTNLREHSILQRAFRLAAHGDQTGLREVDARQSTGEFRYLNARPARGLIISAFKPRATTSCMELQGRLERAEVPTAPQENAACCYARSNKHWTVDPQGIAWESFHSLDTIPVFGEDEAPADSPTKTVEACCVPAVETIKVALPPRVPRLKE